MKNSNIEWTTHTFNPWEGCTKISAGCAHCYAATRNARFGGGTAPNWGKGAPRRRTSVSNWNEPVKWNREALRWANAVKADGGAKPARPRVFCASLADWLDDEVPLAWLADLLDLIRRTPHLDWLLLTKRPENWRTRLDGVWASYPMAFRGDNADWLRDWRGGTAPANVWIGTSVENQDAADTRIPFLLRIPARVRFLSCEPLLGAVRLGGGLYSDYDKAARQDHLLVPAGGFTNAKVNWVIVGGESGPGARPMHPQWARDLRDECEEAGVAFLFKQMGEWAPVVGDVITQPIGKGGSFDDGVWHPDQYEIGRTHMVRVGKSAAGRLLDGREWNEVPRLQSS